MRRERPRWALVLNRKTGRIDEVRLSSEAAAVACHGPGSFVAREDDEMIPTYPDDTIQSNPRRVLDEDDGAD